MKKRYLKSLVIILVFTLIITGIPLKGFAKEEDLSKDIQKIKSLFNIGDEYEHFNNSKYDRSDGNYETNLSWSGQNKHLNVTIDEEGNIISYYKDEYDNGRNARVYKFPKTTKKDGEKTAKEFIKKLYPEILEKIEINVEANSYSLYSRENLREYTYNFTRVENDMFYNGNNVYIGVDTQTGEVRNFGINWEKDLKFVDTKDTISKDEAKEIYKDNIDLELVYKVKDTDEETKSYLGYNIIDTDKTVDAKTKDVLITSYKYMYSVYGSQFNKIMAKISIEEENKLIDSKKIISRKEAGKKLVDTFKLGEGYEVDDYTLIGSKEKDIYVWEVMVMKRVGNSASGTGSRVNAKTGEIISFYDPGSWEQEEEKSKYNKGELLAKAKEFIKNSNAENYEEVEYVEDKNEDLIYDRENTSNFVFIRKVNDIKVENNGFRISLSNVTGNVLSYDYNWNDLEFESPQNIIDKNEAKEILLKDRELDLQYQIENKEKENVKLVYDFEDKYLVVDAKKGEVIDNRKELLGKTEKQEYNDIQNSFAKNQIIKLQDYIILFEGEEFQPKQEIIQKEFLKLLVQTKDIYYIPEDENYMYERFIRDGILKEEEKDMEAKLTREEAVKYIVRVFGQEPLDNLGDIYKVEYKDADKISTNLKGHIAIAKGLGFISGEGNFRPKDNLTREEAVVLIYNILNRDN
ncbi:S-layer homology domain-containing protein [Tissierella sp.]|uniref:S-layer homology domain-containing protein n=1 Tax=Tissierella sp. TaxID=41274 RepID=UPI00286222E5|nr:S-layer homology domain-containing protein [Tissierella sp.]MDR7857213.1 S-layer homology domain-containing protein [Tissierella sp.]